MRIFAEFLYPAPKHVLMMVKSCDTLLAATHVYLAIFTASSLNSQMNFILVYKGNLQFHLHLIKVSLKPAAAQIFFYTKKVMKAPRPCAMSS